METERAEYIRISEEFKNESKIRGKILVITSGIFIGLGVGGWIALGMNPNTALALSLYSGAIGLGGAVSILNRKHFESEFKSFLERLDGQI